MLFGLLWAHFLTQWTWVSGVLRLTVPDDRRSSLMRVGGSSVPSCPEWTGSASSRRQRDYILIIEAFAPSQQMWCSACYPHTIHALLAEHWRLGVFSSQAGGMRRADLLRAGGAAAVIHFRLVNVRQEALVAVFIWRREEGKGTEHEVTALTAFLKYILLCISLEQPLISSWNEQ